MQEQVRFLSISPRMDFLSCTVEMQVGGCLVAHPKKREEAAIAETMTMQNLCILFPIENLLPILQFAITFHMLCETRKGMVFSRL